MRSIALIPQNDHQRPKAQLLDAIEKTNSKLENILLSLTVILLILQLVRSFVWRQDHRTDDRDHNLDSNGVKGTFEDLMVESIKLMKKERSSQMKGLVTMLCVLLFARRDGLPLAIFTSLLYAAKKMKSRGAIIQKLPASATIGLVTTICLDGKTADLVLRHANMADLWVGTSLVDQNLLRQVDNQILDALREGIFVHTGHSGQADISLLIWARPVLGLNIDHQFHTNCSIIRHEAPDMDKNLVSCLVMKKHNSTASDKVLHVHWKGDPQLIVFMCSRYYTVDGTMETLDDNKRSEFLQIVYGLVSCGRRCFAFAYKQETQEEEKSRTEEKEREEGQVIGDDDINTARIMALNCGILRPEDDISGGGAVVEASDFRTSSEEDRMNMIDNFHVVANSSPADKLLMVQCLRQKGEKVAATASCIRDCPPLKQADVGIFTGDDDQCPQLFKEDGDILVLNKNSSQIPGIISLGKQVCENLEKIVNLQLTMGISAFTVNFIGAAALDSEDFISSFQLLWTNLIMEVLGALAMAIATVHTQYSSERDKSQPVYGSGPVITKTMYRNIALQSAFQVTVILILGTKGKTCFQVSESALKTMIFNCYAFCQVFLLISSSIDLKKTDILGRGRSSSASKKNFLFLGILVIIGILQVALSEMMGVVGHWAKLEIKECSINVENPKHVNVIIQFMNAGVLGAVFLRPAGLGINPIPMEDYLNRSGDGVGYVCEAGIMLGREILGGLLSIGVCKSWATHLVVLCTQRERLPAEGGGGRRRRRRREGTEEETAGPREGGSRREEKEAKREGREEEEEAARWRGRRRRRRRRRGRERKMIRRRGWQIWAPGGRRGGDGSRRARGKRCGHGGKSCGGGRSVRKRKGVATGRRKGEAAALGEVVGVGGGRGEEDGGLGRR
ncbi:Calcium-transporting ATPase 12, plasma membrane-type [Sesamum angolense]|uniref:Calcium-transporting ATPase 12, plasma membrane-type n=1 Tax=Sesamum angolense TaxID=2727404 RepID=A0AAE1WSR8_9LAMI|nr:Calcium-transporting ATPase 12, plasma membrane-type [Sesamum angolense]